MKYAVVTGATSGIGKEISKMLVQKEYNIIIVARNQSALVETKNELNNLNPNVLVHTYSCDLHNYDSIEGLKSVVENHFGSLDLLVNNVGSLTLKSIMDIEKEELDNEISLNLMAPVYLTKELFKFFKKNHKSNIINISSDMSFKPSNVGGVYGASKLALNYITKSLALELVGLNIRVNAIAPGAVDTPLLNSISNQLNKEINTLLGSKVDPREVAQWVNNILESDSMTGSIINVDGGNSI